MMLCHAELWEAHPDQVRLNTSQSTCVLMNCPHIGPALSGLLKHRACEDTESELRSEFGRHDD